MRWDYLTREWRQRSGNVPKCGFCVWRSNGERYRACDPLWKYAPSLGGPTVEIFFSTKGVDPLFSKKPFFFGIKKKKINSRYLVRMTTQASHLYRFSTGRRRRSDRFVEFFFLVSSTRYEIKSAEHILKKLVLWSFEIRKSYDTIQID